MSKQLKLTILGSGSSGGVPRAGGFDGRGDWGACDPNEKKNYRTRCSILVQCIKTQDGEDPQQTTSVLVDTSPDMRAQLLAARCARVDAVLYSHDHADQANGIDDLRGFALSMRKQIPVYLDEDTAATLVSRFRYCFSQVAGSQYPAILEQRKMPACGNNFKIGGPSGEIPCTPFLQFHGSINSLGFRFGDIAYSSDVVGFPEESFECLEGVDTWIVDALQYHPHATHAHLDLALEWIARVKPRRAILTNLHIHMDYQTLIRELPDGVEPAFDGMVLNVNC